MGGGGKGCSGEVILKFRRWVFPAVLSTSHDYVLPVDLLQDLH